MKSFVGKHRKLAVFLLIAVAVIAAALFLVSQVMARRRMSAAAASGMQQKTARVERRTLVESISATGKVASSGKKEVVANVKDVEVKEVNVEVGDTVVQGDVLCVLDSTDFETKLANARSSLSVTQEKAQMDVTSAQRSLAEAQTTRDTNLERANEDVAAAWNEYQEAVSDMAAAETAWGEAMANTIQKQAEYENCTDETRKEELLNQYNTAKQNESSCATAYTQAQSTAESRLNTYNQKVRSKEDTVKSDENTVASREESLKVSSLNASVTGSSDEEQVEQYEKQIAACTVTAPISGVVTAVNVDEGDTYGGTTIVTIEDLSACEITAEIDEYDIGSVQVGQKSVIKTNGTGDEEFSGVVTAIAPRASSSSGSSGSSSSVTYTVTISPDTMSDKLKLDMTAKLSIILESKENVLTVPYECVQQDSDGNYYVEAVEGESGAESGQPGSGGAPGGMPDGAGAPSGGGMTGNTKKVPVTKGIESDYYVEVSGEGIEEGMTVIVPVTRQDNSDMSEMMMNRGPMGGF